MNCRSLRLIFMKVTATYKNIWDISYPIILGSLATTVLNLTDTAFIARVGETELGAVAITSVFYFVIIMVGMALGTGAQILMSRRAGEGNHIEIGKLFDHSFLMLSVLGVITAVILFFLSGDFFELILSSPQIIDACNEYMDVRIYGIIFTMASIPFRSFYIAISKTRIITYSSVLMLVLNVLLDYLLIFGNFGFPEMGLAGAALASVIAECISLGYLMIYSELKHEFRDFRLFRFLEPQFQRVRAIVHLSSPVILQNVLSMGSWFIFFVLIEHMGEHELAISNVVRATYMVLMTPIWGFASATNSMVSNIIGQNKTHEVKDLVTKIMILGMFTTLIIFAISIISPRWLLGIITPDIRLINDSLNCFYIVSAAMLVLTISIIMLNTIFGTGNTRAAMVIEIFNITIYLIYVYLCAIVWDASIETVWLSEILYWSLMGLLAALYLKFGDWKKIKL